MTTPNQANKDVMALNANLTKVIESFANTAHGTDSEIKAMILQSLSELYVKQGLAADLPKHFLLDNVGDMFDFFNNIQIETGYSIQELSKH